MLVLPPPPAKQLDGKRETQLNVLSSQLLEGSETIQSQLQSSETLKRRRIYNYKKRIKLKFRETMCLYILPFIRPHGRLTFSKLHRAFRGEVNLRQDEGSRVKTNEGGGETKRSMTLRCEGTVADLSSLESNNHVGSRTKHGEVTSNRGRERDLQPLVRRGVRESGGKHLAHGYI